jgi:hypothetical protein
MKEPNFWRRNEKPRRSLTKSKKRKIGWRNSRLINERTSIEMTRESSEEKRRSGRRMKRGEEDLCLRGTLTGIGDHLVLLSVDHLVLLCAGRMIEIGEGLMIDETLIEGGMMIDEEIIRLVEIEIPEIDRACRLEEGSVFPLSFRAMLISSHLSPLHRTDLDEICPRLHYLLDLIHTHLDPHLVDLPLHRGQEAIRTVPIGMVQWSHLPDAILQPGWAQESGTGAGKGIPGQFLPSQWRDMPLVLPSIASAITDH